MAESVVPQYVHELRSVFQTIAQRIEELIVLLNELHDVDPHIRNLADQIHRYLKKLEKSIKREKGLSKGLSPEKRTLFLGLMQKELSSIRELETYLAVSKRKPKPEVIVKINNLYKEIAKTMAVQENMIKAA